jgi:hypothetical protein
MIETLDELHASSELEIFQSSEEDESVIEQIVSVQREEPEQEIAALLGRMGDQPADTCDGFLGGRAVWHVRKWRDGIRFVNPELPG